MQLGVHEVHFPRDWFIGYAAVEAKRYWEKRFSSLSLTFSLTFFFFEKMGFQCVVIRWIFYENIVELNLFSRWLMCASKDLCIRWRWSLFDVNCFTFFSSYSNRNVCGLCKIFHFFFYYRSYNSFFFLKSTKWAEDANILISLR